MDISGIDIGAIVAAAGALAKSFHSDSKATAVQQDRKETKDSLEVWKREIEMKINSHEEALHQSAERFKKTDEKMDIINSKIDEVNSKVDRLIGFISASSGQKELIK